ncbi:type 1 glutamine amidotransferase domain-containing protein [Novosphingobium sp.]|uniref:type 1 glutamine amidotransferase domain-containing protein n=1 Tax=Novosphingobium sp. TaxID=1874826 RepID=UPI0025F3B3DE|nr:type 1 glutamine amidotransferase domain-containing protein [Novosphingobium sp.]
MSRVLIILPQTDFDPTEVAFPWQVWTRAGHAVAFATETGQPAACDPVTLSGAGLPALARSLRARGKAREAYAAMIGDATYLQPLTWAAARAADFAALHFPGGHAPGMRAYCESAEVMRLAREAFGAHQPVSAVCHGVLPLARAGLLAGRRTTALTAMQENIAVALTRRALPGHYRTYPETVEAEVTRHLGAKGTFERGPLIPSFANAAAPHAGFVVQDLRYLSGRWPGDAWTLAERMLDLL